MDAIVDNHIVELYEAHNVSVEDIATTLSLSTESVTKVLSKLSSEYRRRQLTNTTAPAEAALATISTELPEPLEQSAIVSDTLFNSLKDHYVELAMAESTPPSVKERALRFLLEEKLGRNRKRAAMPSAVISLDRFNEAIKRASEAAASQIIDIKTINKDPMLDVAK